MLNLFIMAQIHSKKSYLLKLFRHVVTSGIREHAGLDKFTSTRPIFRGRNFTCESDRARKMQVPKTKCVSDQETTRNITFCFLLSR